MLPLFSLRSPKRSVARRASLQVEALEDRTCPAAPTLSYTAAEIGPGLVRIVGEVNDESPGTTWVSFTGLLTASVAPDAQGHFDFSAPVGSLGTIEGVVYDQEMLSSDTVAVEFTSDLPTVTIDQITWGANRQVTITGRVTDEFAAGREVSFYGAASGTAVTDEQGNYSITMTANVLGEIQAYALDPWWQQGVASSELTNNQPAISDFQVSIAPGRFYTFTGRVTDEFAPGLTVSFGGLAALAGKTATVREDGTFSICVQLAENDYGEATCSVVDWWSVESEVASVLVL